MRFRLIAFVAAALLLAMVGGPAGAAASTAPASAVSGIPVTGTFTDAAGPGAFSGTLDITRFASQNGRLVAVGTLSGTLTDANGMTRSVANRPVTLPVTRVGAGGVAQQSAPVGTQQATSCQILHLEFGGITIDVLGIMVTLSPITLDISLGGILGTLLCALLGALTGAASPQAQATLLNNLLGL
jgi:hypothetical protein